MPKVEVIAQYGVAALSVAVIAYIVAQFATVLTKRRNGSLTVVIENNTRALDNLKDVLITFREAVAQSMARQEAKIDELLARARKGG